MRRLKHQRLRTHSDLQKTTQRLFSIEGSLHVERTSQTSTNREIVAASHFGEVCTSACSKRPDDRAASGSFVPDSKLLDNERGALEARSKCMSDLLESHQLEGTRSEAPDRDG